MAEYDNKAFSNMQEATAGASDDMFTESEYNMNATNKERQDYDSRAYDLLQNLYHEDKAKYSDIKDWDFSRYLENLSNSRLEEIFTKTKKGDPSFYNKAGELLSKVYADDVDQLKLSAYNFYASQGKRGTPIDRSNISVKAPTGGSTWDKERMLDERSQ